MVQTVYKKRTERNRLVSDNEVKALWWETNSKEEAAKQLDAYVAGLLKSQKDYIHFNNIVHARLYSNRRYTATYGANYGMKKERGFDSTRLALKQNIVKSVIDAVVAKISKTKVRVRFLTDGGSYSQKQRSSMLNKFISGLFYETNTHDITTKVFRDACIFGTGFIKVYAKSVYNRKKKIMEQKVAIERVSPDEIIVDPLDSYNGSPRSLHQIKYISRNTLIAMFPDKKTEIMRANVHESGEAEGQYVEMLRVIEGWALPIGKSKGKHIIQVDGTLLYEEEWTKDHFPFAVIRYTDPVFGYFGSGITEDIKGLQIEINRLLYSIQNAMHMLSSPKILVQKGSINLRHYTNEIATFIEYDGPMKPEVYAPSAVPNGAIEQVQMYKRDAYQLAGISQLSASSQKPEGLNSGKAITEFRDAETERFSQTVRAFEQLHIDLAEIMLDVVREIGDDYQTTAFDRVRGIEVVDWKQIKIDKNGYVMQIFTGSQLPNDPTGRLQHIQEYLQSGILGANDALELLELPDLDAKVELQLAPYRNIQKNLDLILEGKEASLPEVTDPLNFALEVAIQSYSYARERDLAEDVQEQLRIYIEDVEGLIRQGQEQEATRQMAAQQAAQAPIAQMQEQQLAGQEPAGMQGELVAPQ